MVNVPGRSKGCSTCRQRRLKCDENSPKCFQCVRKGLRCTGPRTGAVFIHSIPSQPPSVCASKKTRIPGDEVHQQISISSLTAEHDIENSLLPSVYQPSRVEIFDQLFVSHFIESFAFKEPRSGKQPSTWLDDIAEFIVSPTQNTVQHSIRASSMFFYGFLAEDIAIQTEASRWYLRALQGLQKCLSQKPVSSFSDYMICTAVMLTHFESLAGTASGAWFQHVQGASMMIAQGGPESCRQGFLHKIFRHLRLLTAISSLFRNEQHPFCTVEWMTVPFGFNSKGPFDELVDIFYSLLPCLEIADKAIAFEGADTSSLGPELCGPLIQTMTHMHTWWSRCFGRTDLSQANPEATYPTNEDCIDVPGDPCDALLLPYGDMPTAALAALFDAANVIVFRLFFLVSSSAHLYENRIQQHIQSIFSALSFVSNMPQPISQRGYIMVALPIQIVRIWAPCKGRDDVTKLLKGGYGQEGQFSAPSEFFAHIASYIHSYYSIPEMTFP